jgi:redox-sensitive bicupin YhaK (pirin superfamily)
MLDEFNVNAKGGFPDHPHRGFQTVTYMFPHSTGSFEHEDFVGNRGLLKPGMLQWMTAGRGILHSEMPNVKEGEIAHGLQLWINLAAKDKMCEPTYQELPTEQVPKVKKDGIEAHVIAGSALGVESPIYTRTPGQ